MVTTPSSEEPHVMWTEMLASIPEEWDEEADVVIIGAGGAGLAAAISAAEMRANTIVLEKMAHIGGCTAVSGGTMAASSSKYGFQQKLGIKDSKELHYRDTMKGGGYVNDPKLVWILVGKAPDAVNWLDDLGIEYTEMLTWGGGHSVPRGYHAAGGGSDIIKVLGKAAEKISVNIFLKHAATRIIREKPFEGRVLGVEAEREGTKLSFKAKRAVVVASGGFGLNKCMVARHDPRLSDLPSTNPKGVTMGEGVLMCQEIRAGTRGMDYIQCFPLCDVDTESVLGPGLIHLDAILVNREGLRFVDEKEQRDVKRDAILEQRGKTAFVIFDDAILVHEVEEASRRYMLPALKDQMRRKRAFKEETVKELAKKAGLNAENLVKTVEKWNSYIDAGRDPEFQRRDVAKGLGIKIEVPPFYASEGCPAIHHTCGGLHINSEAQVLDIYGKVIPGLYAAGEVVGGIHGANRLATNAITDIIVFGRIAGKNAAADRA